MSSSLPKRTLFFIIVFKSHSQCSIVPKLSFIVHKLYVKIKKAITNKVITFFFFYILLLLNSLQYLLVASCHKGSLSRTSLILLLYKEEDIESSSTTIIFSLCLILINNKIFIHSLGILSAIFESLTCVPQVIENYKTKNSQNVSFTMIFCWFLGDSFRLYYNIKYKAPIQMITAISVQVTLDIIVCIQLIMYRDFGKKSPINTAKKKIEDINKLMKKIDEINIFEKKKEGNKLEQIEIKKNNSGEENEGEKNEQKLDQTNNSDPDTTLK